MKKYIILCLTALMSIMGAKADNVSVGDVVIYAGQTSTVAISLTNTNTGYVSFQMDLTLPAGITINKTGCSLTKRVTDTDQKLTIGKQGTNVYRITSTSFNLKPIAGTSGELILLSLSATTGSASGQAQLSNVRFATANSQRVAMADVAFEVIVPVPATVTKAPTAKTLTYTGFAQQLVNAGTATGGTMQYSLNGTNYSTGIPTATDAGTYKVYYKVVGDEYHTDTTPASISVTINKAAAAVAEAPKAKALTYTGIAQQLVNAGVASGGTMQYSSDGKTYGTSIPMGTKAGSYTVYYKVVGDANHTDTQPATVSATINKAAAAVAKAATAKTLTYTGSAQQLINAGTATGGTMQYSLDGTTFSANIPTATDAATYKVYYKVVGDANHTDTAPATVSVTIQKAASAVTTAPTAKTLTYTGGAQPLVNAGVASGGTMQYSSDGKTYGTSIPTGTNAGSYTVYYKVVGDANHTDTQPATVSATINKAAAAVTTAPTAKTLTYTGGAQPLVNAGVASGGTMQYSSDGKTYGTSIPAGTNAGSYTIYYRVVGDANHTDTAPATVSVTINKAAAAVAKAPTAKTLTFTGMAQQLINAGTATGGTMQYSLDGTTYSTNIPTATDASTYKVYYKVVGDENHNDTPPATVSVTISKATATVITAPTAKTLTYTGFPQQLITAGIAMDGTMQYSLNGTNYSTSIPTATDAGTYTVYFKVVGDANHYDTEPETVVVTIKEPEGKKGDVNSDGKVDVADIAAVIAVMAKGEDHALFHAADVNNDGTVDVADIAAVLAVMASSARGG